VVIQINKLKANHNHNCSKFGKNGKFKAANLEKIDSSSRRATLAGAVPMQQSGIGSPTIGGQHQAQSRSGYEAMRPEHL